MSVSYRDKAIDLIDEAGAAHALHSKSRQKRLITKKDIETVVAEICQVAPVTISTSDKNSLQQLEPRLQAVIYGQDDAISKLSKAIKLARAALHDTDKPVACFLFTGPTGVGKTELSKQLARILGIRFLRFDMSEYSEKHTVSRLIGAPPGYVGYEHGGLLTDAVHKTPYAVLLMDEIEKAHPEIFNILLQVMDHGILTDSNGRKSDFRNMILIMTSNVGARELTSERIGFDKHNVVGENKKAVERCFSPEFINRLDAVITFNSLSRSLITRVLDKFINQLTRKLSKKKVALDISDAVRSYLIDKGYDPKYGARSMARFLQSEIQEKLVDELLFGKLVRGGTVSVVLHKMKMVSIKILPR